MWRTGQVWVEQEERKEERGRKRKEKKGRKGEGQTRKTHTTKQSSCVSPGKDYVGCYLSWVGWVGDVSASKPPPLRICVNSGPWKQRLRKHLLAEELTSGRGKANQLGTFILTDSHKEHLAFPERQIKLAIWSSWSQFPDWCCDSLLQRWRSRCKTQTHPTYCDGKLDVTVKSGKANNETASNNWVLTEWAGQEVGWTPSWSGVGRPAQSWKLPATR